MSRRGGNVCPAVEKHKVVLLADTLICYLVNLFHTASLFYTNDMKYFLRVVKWGIKDITKFVVYFRVR